MRLVESYLNEVARFLPENQRTLVLDELRDDILGEIEGRAETFDRSPSNEDEEVVLTRFGHPLKIAGRYQPQKYVIGPELYPAFIHTLKAMFGLVIFIQVIAALISAQTNGWQIGPLELLFSMLDKMLWVGAIVVLVFVAIEYSEERLNWYKGWKPRHLATSSLGVINRGDVITNLFSEGFFLLWWNDVIRLPLSYEGAGDEFFIKLSPVWDGYSMALNLVFGTAFLLHFYVLIRGIWSRGTLLAEMASNIALIGIAIGLLSQGILIEFSAIDEAGLGENTQTVVKTSIGVVAAVCIWDLWLAWSNFRGSNLPRQQYVPE